MLIMDLTLKQQAKNLFKDLGTVLVKYKNTGKLLASTETIQERLKVCVSCDNYNAEKKRCKSCGCYTNKKVLFENIKCPLDKWRK